MNLARSRPPENPGALAQGGARRKDVVEEEDSARHRTPRRVGARDVRPARAGGEFDLIPGPTHYPKFIQNRHAYPLRHPSGHELCLVEASPGEPGAVQRHRHHRVEPAVTAVARESTRHKRRHHLLHDAKGPLVLEGVHELLPHPLVAQRSPRALEPEVPIPALAAPVDLEGRRGPASPAERMPHEGQGLKARSAKNIARPPITADAPLRVEEVREDLYVGFVEALSHRCPAFLPAADQPKCRLSDELEAHALG